MNNTLPKNWTISTLGEISLPSQYGFTAKAQHSGNIHYLRTTDITSGSIDWNNVPFCDVSNDDLEKFKLYDGDILISRAGSVGYSILVQNPKSSVFASYLIRFRPLINSKYLSYYLNTPQYWDLVKQESAGIAVQNLNASKLSNFTIPIAPINEQEKIVSKIDELFSELDNGIEELETAQKKLEIYRQSLLKSAVEGELSKEWRETQTEISETGEQLLARILKERRERWEQEKLKEFAERGKNPPKDWKEKYPEPVQPDTDNLPQLPEGWVWAGNNQVALIQLGRQRSPSKLKGDNPQKYIRAANITENGINLDDVLEMDFTEKEVQNYQLKTGDILLTEASGSPQHVGRPAIWNNSDDEIYCFQNTVIRFQGLNILPEYAYFIFLAYQKLGKFSELSGGVGINHLSANKFSMVCIPLPPLDEQKFIVKELKLKLNSQEQQLNELKSLIQLNRAQKLNILKDAFTGKLVPQDPDDEPAQVLLERIQQQQVAEALTKKATPKKRSTSKSKKEVGMSRTILEILQQQSDWISGQDLATAFGLNGNSNIEDIEQFYEQLRTLSLDDKIMVKPDQQNNKEQDLIKLKDKTDAS
ncbi:TPA: restriction endonuclease subunit S [Acinetobacter baumannii]|nr:restriction endonuclease subunit S [Acinetobacter baumannii]